MREMPRYSSSRQKACQHCSTAKVKCDFKVGSCSRCSQRGLQCIYVKYSNPQNSAGTFNKGNDSKSFKQPPGHLPSPEVTQSTSNSPLDITTSQEFGKWQSADSTYDNDHSQNARVSSPVLNRAVASDTLNFCANKVDFQQLDLVCPIDADAISCRWLNPYVPSPGQNIKSYPPRVTSFIYRVLKSYAAVAIRGHGVPPFVHPSQFTIPSNSTPLSTCLNLTHIWDAPRPDSEGIASEILSNEMRKLYECHGTLDHINLLAAFQAYLIYAMVLFFYSIQTSTSLRQAVTNLQEIACKTSRQGLACSADLYAQRPTWEAWIVAETKRRVLYTMCLFDSLLSVHEGLPTFLSIELTGLLAPGTQILWQAGDRKEWEKACTHHLAEWTDGYLRINELWPITADINESAIAERQRRIDHWLENVDAFGMMLYTVTSQTHGT